MSGLKGGSYLLTASADESLGIGGLVWGACVGGIRIGSLSSLSDGVNGLCNSSGLKGLLIVTRGLDKVAIGLSSVTIGLVSCMSPSWLVSVASGLVRDAPWPDANERLFHVDSEVLWIGGNDVTGNCLPL